MAFRSNGPISLALPPFRGVTRRIILIALGVYFGSLLLGMLSNDTYQLLMNLVMLHPNKALHTLIFELITYPFLNLGLLSTAFALLSIWFFGSTLEDDRGSRWLSEYFLVTTIGGAILASLVTFVPGAERLGLGATVRAAGLWPFVLALIVAFASFNPEQELRFNFIFTLKAKYLAAIYVLFYVASALIGGDQFGTLVGLMNALAGYAYLRLAPRRGLRVGASEQWFGLRNAWYRAKRRRAAKKFTVYMKKQGKDVSLDADGRYVDPDGRPRDVGDRNWMN